MEINKKLIGKQYKDRLTGIIFTVERGYKVIDDLGNVERVYYKTVGNVGGVPCVHYDVCQLSIIKGLI